MDMFRAPAGQKLGNKFIRDNAIEYLQQSKTEITNTEQVISEDNPKSNSKEQSR